MTESEIKSLGLIVRHFIDDEERDYRDSLSNCEADNNHIYNHLAAMRKFIENDKQLNRCPCCGESDFEIEKTDKGLRVHCYGCGMLGPVKQNEEDAMQAWNNRA